MKEWALPYLTCPACGADLEIREARRVVEGAIAEGLLGCRACAAGYPITGSIPRFVPPDSYASSFGLQWKKHARTQHDSFSGTPVSENRFFSETGWNRDLTGELMLEVGSGAGRFTPHAASTSATVLSLDLSQAVEVNQDLNGSLPRVQVIQGDVYRLPVKRGIFDKVFCFGMLQHTPDVARAFSCLPPALRPGGSLVVDVYRKSLLSTLFSTKYYARHLTTRMDPERLHRFTVAWIHLMWPLCSMIRRIPHFGHRINWRLLVADHSPLGLSGEMLKEWAILDTYDMLAPRYDSPQTRPTVEEWFREAGLVDVRVDFGHNGIEGRGRRPPGERSA